MIQATRQQDQQGQDEQLRRNVFQAIDQLGYPQLLNTRCLVTDGDVELRGEVGSWYMKQLLQTAVLGVAGVRQVRNQVQVTVSKT